MDFLLRSVELRPTAWIGITPGLGSDLLRARPRQELFPSAGPMGYQETAQTRSSVSPALRMTRVANILQEEGIDLGLPMFRRGNTPSPAHGGALESSPKDAGEIIFGGAGLFRNDKLVAWLSPLAVRGQLWARGEVAHGSVTAPCQDPKEQATFRLRSSKGSVTTKMQGGRPRSRIQVQVIADANEVDCSEEVVIHGDVSRLERMLAKEVQGEIEAALKVSRQKGADIFGLGQALFRSDPAAFHQAEPWREP